MTVKSVHHVAVAVDDIERALAFWRDALGLPLSETRDVPAEKSQVAFLPVGGTEVELVQPTADDTGLAKFLAKRGPGLHHLCLEVDDISAALAQLKSKDIRLIDEAPKTGEGGRQYAFVHPAGTGGVLVELYQLAAERRVFPTLETERLILREFSLADIPMVFDLFRRQDVNTWLDRDPMQIIEEAERSVRSRMSLFTNGMGFRWAIVSKDNPDRLIGSCGYFSVRRGTATVEIGYELHPDYWRKGFMTEALRAAIDYSYSERAILPVHRIEALVMPGNAGSVRLLEKLGFKNEGLRREFGYWSGSYQDVILFALLPSDWGQ